MAACWPGPAPGRRGPGPAHGLLAPNARCHPRRVTRRTGRHRRAGREPVGAGAGRAGAGLAAKKKSVYAAERGTERARNLRAAFVEALQQADFTCCKFVDETSTNLTYCRRYARAEGGPRAGQGALHGGPNVTLVAALTPHGLQAACKRPASGLQAACKRP